MRTIFTAVAMVTTVIATVSWVLYVYGMGLRRAAGQDLFGFANTYYWGMAVGSPFAFVALFVHPVIVDKVNSWIARGLWTLLFVALIAWQLCFSGAVLSRSSQEIDLVRGQGNLVDNDLGLIFCGALGSVVFAGMSVGIYYARDILQIEELR